MTKVHGGQPAKSAHSTQSTTHGQGNGHHHKPASETNSQTGNATKISGKTQSTPTQSQPESVKPQSAPAQTSPPESSSKPSLSELIHGKPGASYTDPTTGKTYTDPKATGTWTDPETGKTHWQYPATGAGGKSGPPPKPISYYPIGQEGGWGLTA